MNAFNKFEMESPGGELLESCDLCNCLIRNWEWMGWSFLTFDGKIICNDCRTNLLKNLTSGEKSIE